MHCIMRRHQCVAFVRPGVPLQVDNPLAQPPVVLAWRRAVQAECLAELLNYLGVGAYEQVLSQIEACEDGLAETVCFAAVLQTLIDCNRLPAKVLVDAHTVFGRHVEAGELVSLYAGLT